MTTVLALALNIFGCACLYLATPNQKWRSKAPPRKPLLATGSLLLTIDLAVWIAALRPLSGVVVTLDIAMVCLVAFPYLAALGGILRRN
jgi:hypothetical protein